jgi:hypothetical protein
MISLSKLPLQTPFAPVQMYGVALNLVAADPNLQIELQRAPDVAGAPGAFTSLGPTGPYPRGQGVYIDWLPGNLTISGFWYQARHVGPNVDPSAWSASIGPVIPYLVRRALYDSGYQDPIGHDGVRDGRVFRKSVNFGGGDNVVENGNFEASPSLVPTVPLDHPDWPVAYTPPGWILYSFNDSTISYETATQFSGVQSLKVVTLHSGAGVMMEKRFKASAGEVWKISGAMKVLAGGTARIGLVARNGSGGGLSEIPLDCTGTAWTTGSATGVLPAGTVMLTLHCYMAVSGTGWFDDIVCVRARQSDTEVIRSGSDVTMVGTIVSQLDNSGNVAGGILPTAGVLDGASSSKLYRHREDIQVTGADTDGDVPVTFGLTYQNAPQVTFRGGQFVSFSSTLPAGKQRTRLQVVGLSSSGFTSSSQIVSVGVTTAQDDDFPSGNSLLVVGDNCVLALAPGGANDNNYTVHYRGSVTINANGTNFCQATLVVAISTDDGTGYTERGTFTYSAAPLSGPPPYSAATTTFTGEAKTITVSGLTGATKNIKISIKSLTFSNGGSGSAQVSGFDGAGTVVDAGVHGVTYTTATDTLESAIPSNGDQVLWAAQEVA